MGDFTASPDAPALAVVAWLRRDGGTTAGRPAVPGATATRSGQAHLEALAGDLDDDGVARLAGGRRLELGRPTRGCR